MSTALQLNPPLPVKICIRGAWWSGMAHIMIDPGLEYDLLWVCFLDRGGVCWTARNQDIRMQSNLTMGRQ